MSEKCLPTEKKKSFFPKKAKIDWRKVCRDMLARSLPTNPLTTQPDAPDRPDDNLNISLGYIEQQQHPGTDGLVTADELAFSPRIRIEQTIAQEQFLEQLQAGKSSSQGRRIAIVGESGTGKTTLLQKIAKWLIEKTDDVPIWITPSQLGTNLFDQYLRQKWLPQASQGVNLPPIEWQEAFEELLNSGRVWLLLDSVDERLLRLLTVAQQIRSWTDKVRIIITCRTYIWRNNRDALAAFDTYQTLEFSYPEQITQFIDNWFAPTSAMPYGKAIANAKTTEAEEHLGKKLLKTLENPEKEQIRQVIKNPLRLALLCRLWQHHPQNLPDTKAELYQRLLPEFYQWKAEAIATNAQQQQALNSALERLALRAMQEAKTFPDRFSHQLVTSVLGEDSPLLRMAIRLGWLQTIGAFAENSQEKYYTFFDTTFVQYFAARAVSDWQFFFARQLDKERQLNTSSESYRIFEPHWKPSILFWLGREDIAREEKAAFINALLSFDDGCGCENFYGKRAYFLAAAGIAEFSDSNKAEEIIAKLVDWGFAGSPDRLARPLAVAARLALQETHRRRAIAALVEIVQTHARAEIHQLALASLEKIGKGDLQAKTALERVLETTQSPAQRWRVAECLGTIDVGNAKAIASTIAALSPSSTEEIQQLALDSLEKIAKKDRRAIAMVINLIRTTPTSPLQRRAFECLETLAPGNASAIASLVQFIRTTKDEGMRCQIAESLEKLDPGNPTAIAVLIQLLQSAQTPEVRQQAVYSLGEISPGNLDAIAALVRLLQTSEDIFLRWVAVSSLGKIAADNREAIEVLVTIIKSPERSLLQKEAIDTLVKIQPNHPVAITALVKLMQYSEDEGVRREAAESLGKIDPTNPEAIAALGYLLRTSRDEFTCRQAAYSLGKIDPNNIDALKTLVRLIHMSREKDIRSLAAESLGEIGNNNPAAIATLIRLIQSTKDRDTLRRAIESLGKIAKGNRDAIAALMELLQSREDETIRLQTADSLIHLLQERQMMLAVSTLRDGFLYKSSTSDLAAYNVMWYCSQRLPYPEFYQAWYFRPLPVQPESNSEADEDNGLNLLQDEPTTIKTVLNDERSLASHLSLQLHRAISAHPQLSDRVRLIHIDSSQLLDRDNPLVDIYDLMLAQNLPKFEYGVPDTMARLKLYWNLIRRTFEERLFVLLLEEDWKKQGFSPIFLELLGKFEGLIGIVSDRPALNLPTFSPGDRELVRTIITWIQTHSQELTIDEIS
jgi:HEAT repeat protein/GTPase SAR1 family protein